MTSPANEIRSGATSGYLTKVALFGVLVIVGFIAVDMMFFAQGGSFKREGGGLETASAVLYLVAAAAFFFHVPKGLWAGLFHVPALMLLFAAREFDFDKAFTQSGILSLRFYSGDSSTMAKLIGGAFAVFSIYVILRILWRGLPAAARALKASELWPWFAILAAALVAGTKSIDGLGRKLLDFGIVISNDLDQTAALVEEVGEAFIPVCAILAIVSRWKGRSL
ncbi:MAG: hypothetical protein AB8B47_11790 [Roseobacter sp.]